MKAEELREQRQKIDAIDQEIVALLEKRMAVVSQIAAIKGDSQVVYDSAREAVVLEQVAELVQQKDYQMAIQETFKDVMKHSRNYQNQQLKQG
ncbi:chorismate mutase [Enterococcus sp. LJL120]